MKFTGVTARHPVQLEDRAEPRARRWRRSGHHRTFKERIEPSLRDSILKKGAQEKCGKILTGSSTSAPPSVESFSGTPVSFFYPGQEGSNDWVTWVGSIEYVEGKPYFYDLQRFRWSI